MVTCRLERRRIARQNISMKSLRRLGRLFVIKTRWEAWMIIYAIAVGAVTRGHLYIAHYPGVGGKLLFVACAALPLVAGPALLDAFPKKRKATAV